VAAVLDLVRALAHRRAEPAHRLLLGRLVMYTGIAALFPVVPLYVRAHGGSAADIALFVAGPMVAATLIQIPAGHLVDRMGRKPTLVWSSVLYAVLCAGLFLDWGPLWLLALLRAGQGASGGAYGPALRAALADLTPADRRGHRYAQLQACEMVGLLVGPAIGGAIALWRYSGIFAATGVAVLLSLAALARVPETRGMDLMPADAGRAETLGNLDADAFTERLANAADGLPQRWWVRAPLLVPAVTLAATGALFSMYDVVWPQYLLVRGYDTLVIGLSISVFAVPILLLAGIAGSLSDRSNRRILVPAGLAVVAACAVTYPLLRNIYPILAVGLAEASAFVVLEPTLFAIISEWAPPSLRGRAMGIGGFFYGGGSAIGAGVLGALYGLGEALPFLAGAAGCVLAAVVCGCALPRRPLHPERFHEYLAATPADADMV
jgi:DHA1 family multidrug resistance protein-like MFS transporter